MPDRAFRRTVVLVAAAAAVSFADLNTTFARDTSPSTVWVFLRDKGVQDDIAGRTAIAQARQSLSADTLRRRAMRGGADSFTLGLQDLPVSSNYASAIAATGADIRVQSRWLNAISITATPQELARIGKLSFVDHLQPVASVGKTLAVPRPVGGESSSANTSMSPADFYGSASVQLNQINIPAVHNLGFTGTGMKIGVLDTGFRRTHEAFNHPGHSINVLAEYDFINNDSDTSDTTNGQHGHGTNVLGIIGGYKPNTYVGGAYNASFLLAKTEDVTQEVPSEEDDWVAGLEFLENNGADVVTSSLGYIDWYTQAQLNGNTAVTTLAAKAAAARGLAITNAAGNEGHDSNPSTSHLIAPADADLLITVGAVNSSNVAASFTSDGPTADGRVKPEVTARGVDTNTVSSSTTNTYVNINGTSFATPLTAAAVTLIVQAHPDWSVEQLRYALFQTASRGGTFDPQYVVGYGLINTLSAVQFSFDKFYTSASNGSWTTGSNWTGGTVPFSLNNVFITPSTGVTVTGPTAVARVNNLTVNATSGTTQLNLASNTTLTVDRTLTIGSRGRINHSAGTFIVSGATVNNGSLNQSAGTSSFALMTGTGSTNVGSTARMTVDGMQQAALTLSGRLTVRPNGTSAAMSRLNALTISGGTLDLNNNDLIVVAGSYGTISSLIATARTGGTWNGAGITSTAAKNANPKLTTLGTLTGQQFHAAQGSGATFDGFTVADSEILVKYTYYGDATFDGKVNGADYARIDSTFNLQVTQGNIGGWYNGDFDYNSKVDGADYALIDLAFNGQGSTVLRMMSFLDGSDTNAESMKTPALARVVDHFNQFGETYALAALTTVPEPALGGVVASASTLLLTARSTRRRRPTLV